MWAGRPTDLRRRAREGALKGGGGVDVIIDDNDQRILERTEMIEIGLLSWRWEEWKLISTVRAQLMQTMTGSLRQLEEQQRMGYQHAETMLICHPNLLQYGEAYQESQTSAILICES